MCSVVRREVGHGPVICNTLQHTATHCDKLRHTARDCDTLQHTVAHCNTPNHTFENVYYGVATISRLLKILGLFCRTSSLSQGSFAKETYHFKEPTNRSHPIWCGELLALGPCVCSMLCCAAVCCGVLQYVVVCCSMLWCAWAMCCSMLWCALQYAVVCCIVLGHVFAVNCGVLHCVVVVFYRGAASGWPWDHDEAQCSSVSVA